MKINIREANLSDLPQYTKLLQKTYQDAYVDDEIGLTKDCFAEEVFNTPDTQKYLTSNLEVNPHQKCWLAFISEQLVGALSIIEKEDDYELRGFYVDPSYQGQGIGRQLWELALQFAKNKDITCDIYAHNKKTIEMYKKWGFAVDAKRGEFYRHWEEWPEGVKAKCIYMRYKVK